MPSRPGAPFTAEAATTVHLTLRDGTRIDRTARARYYRDGAGRVRVEQPNPNPESPDAAGTPHLSITIAAAASDGGVFILDTVARTAGQAPRGMASLAIGGGEAFSLPLGRGQFLIFRRPEAAREHRDRLATGGVEETPLGARRIAGIDTIGRRVTILVEQRGNARPIEVIDERWVSPALQVVIHARSIDPRFGSIEYRLTDVRQTEPDPRLFAIPEDYTPGFPPGTAWHSLWYADNIVPKSGEQWEEIVRQQGFSVARPPQ